MAGHRPAQTAPGLGRKGRPRALAQGLAPSPPGPPPPGDILGSFILKLRNQLHLPPLTHEPKRAPVPPLPPAPAPPQASAAGSSRPSQRPQRGATRRSGAWPAGAMAPPPAASLAPPPHTRLGLLGGASSREGVSQLREVGRPRGEAFPIGGGAVPIFAAVQSGAGDDSGGQPCWPYRSKRRPEAPPGAERRPNSCEQSPPSSPRRHSHPPHFALSNQSEAAACCQSPTFAPPSLPPSHPPP